MPCQHICSCPFTNSHGNANVDALAHEYPNAQYHFHAFTDLNTKQYTYKYSDANQFQNADKHSDANHYANAKQHVHAECNLYTEYYADTKQYTKRDGASQDCYP